MTGCSQMTRNYHLEAYLFCWRMFRCLSKQSALCFMEAILTPTTFVGAQDSDIALLHIQIESVRHIPVQC